MEVIFPYIISALVAVMLFSFIFTIFNIAKYFRTVKDVRRAWYRTRARQCFAIFMFAFAINQMILFPKWFTFVVCAILIIFAVANYQYAIKAKRHFESHFADEDAAWAELEKKQRQR
ncbi:YtpI family protein [Macrococcoides canis]|uniref:YtpI family protein n=1 Tax=Macrococcoides canis TaxID=1855823 RepID=UPI0020B805C4|nr:YtpI family protein [Macrococcus canis]UTH01722.1 YtpI family protein [Macrococcus canis]